MKEDSARDLVEKGVRLFNTGNNLAALSTFERAHALDSTDPVCQSYIALLIATERGQFQKGIKAIQDLVERNPAVPEVYLNLGRLYLKSGSKGQAIETVRKGLGISPIPDGMKFLDALGTRKRPVIPFMARGNPLNRFLGKLFSKLGLR